MYEFILIMIRLEEVFTFKIFLITITFEYDNYDPSIKIHRLFAIQSSFSNSHLCERKLR